MFQTMYKAFLPHTHSCLDQLRNMTVYVLHAIFRRYIRVPALNIALISSRPSNNTRELYLENLTLTKMDANFAEMPRVHVKWVSLTRQMYRIINLIGHTWHPYFSEQRGWPNAYVFSKRLQSNFTKQNTFNQWNSKERDVWKKLLKPQLITTLETLLQKVKVTRHDLDILLRLNLLYLWEYLPFLL